MSDHKLTNEALSFGIWIPQDHAALPIRYSYYIGKTIKLKFKEQRLLKIILYTTISSLCYSFLFENE